MSSSRGQILNATSYRLDCGIGGYPVLVRTRRGNMIKNYNSHTLEKPSKMDEKLGKVPDSFAEAEDKEIH